MEQLSTLTEKEEKVACALIGVVLPNMTQESCDESLDELSRLAETAGAETVVRLTQVRNSPDAATYIGKGKLSQLAESCEFNGISLCICDDELSPSQIRNLEKELDGISVIDRSMLILDIFAFHATTGEGKLQVSLAQMKYTLPRLYGRGKELSRLGGGIGTRGPGESKLESDRRYIKRRIAVYEEELKKLEANRAVQRKQRERSKIKKVAIAGYTNAGKSTLTNYLTGAGILAEDKLFATLDPTTRKFSLPCGEEILLTDTVGFIRRLPHHLVKAFRSTLEEVAYADVIIVMADASDPACDEELKVTSELLEELGAGAKPVIYVYNKCDCHASFLPELRMDIPRENIFYVSAKTGAGVDKLVSRLEELVHEDKSDEIFIIPNNEQQIVAKLFETSVVKSTDYGENYVTVCATVDSSIRGRYKKYLSDEQ